MSPERPPYLRIADELRRRIAEHVREHPEPRQATVEEASLLGIQKAALITHIRRTYYSDQGWPVETADNDGCMDRPGAGKQE
ncbi:UTRA domain-containing protein [Streptomyces sp. NPDC085866]|uniref:UTRA domain-containing protein n=1 Tax=Streptomyces sp. NPDC085866 TaxID=3365736 RepID=UPI0037D4FCB4